MVTIPICLDRFYLPKKSILWSFLYILESVLFHGKIACTKIVGIWCMKINSQKNFSSDLYRILFMHMALLHYIIYLVIAIQPLLCETAQCACSYDLSIMIVGYFSSCFFLWSLCPLGLKSVVLYIDFDTVCQVDVLDCYYQGCTFTIKELHCICFALLSCLYMLYTMYMCNKYWHIKLLLRNIYCVLYV